MPYNKLVETHYKRRSDFGREMELKKKSHPKKQVDFKKYGKLLAVNFLIAGAAVVIYSPGLLNLRPSDYSIFRAGMSIIAGLVLVICFLCINFLLLRTPKKIPISIEDVPDLERAKAILKRYREGAYFGSTARTASTQLDRIFKCRQRLSDLISQKFPPGTMSWDKFYSIIQTAENSAIKNVVTMANRMQLFDEEEYDRLKHYKEDSIPDDIQEEQIRLYQKNLDDIRSVITLNEKILVKLDALSLELSTSESVGDAALNDELLLEIERLTSETKYYT